MFISMFYEIVDDNNKCNWYYPNVWNKSPKSEPALELHSRAAPSVEASPCQRSKHRKKFRLKKWSNRLVGGGNMRGAGKSDSKDCLTRIKIVLPRCCFFPFRTYCRHSTNFWPTPLRCERRGKSRNISSLISTREWIVRKSRERRDRWCRPVRSDRLKGIFKIFMKHGYKYM